MSSTTASDAELTSSYNLNVNSYNALIDQFFIFDAISSSAICVGGTAFQIFFLGKFDILSPDEIERLVEKLVTLYQDDIEQPRARHGPRAGAGPRPDFVRPARCS